MISSRLLLRLLFVGVGLVVLSDYADCSRFDQNVRIAAEDIDNDGTPDIFLVKRNPVAKKDKSSESESGSKEGFDFDKIAKGIGKGIGKIKKQFKKGFETVKKHFKKLTGVGKKGKGNKDSEEEKEDDDKTSTTTEAAETSTTEAPSRR